jgi:hypothetical protein
VPVSLLPQMAVVQGLLEVMVSFSSSLPVMMPSTVTTS